MTAEADRTERSNTPETREQAQAAAADGERSRLPIFVIGCHRSGTTLTRYVLDTHPAIACPPESKYLVGLVSFLQTPRAMAGIDGLGASDAEVRQHLRDFASSFLDDYARRKGKRRWADKTPNYHRIVELLDYVFEEKALYVLVVRHPLDVIPSLRSYLEAEFLLGAAEPFLMEVAVRHGIGEYGAALYWLEFTRRLWVFSQMVGDRACWLRYEDLVSEPEATLATLFRFLGEDFDPDLVSKVFEVEHDHGFEFGGIRSRRAIEPDRVGKWKGWPRQRIQALWELVGSEAARFGYGIEGT
jgi:protein-tyrosine sulfotransferase